VTFTNEKPVFLKYFTREEWQDWKATNYDITPKTMLSRIEEGAKKKGVDRSNELDKLLAQAIWNGDESAVDKLVTFQGLTVSAVNQGLELALSLNDTSIFVKLFNKAKSLAKEITNLPGNRHRQPVIQGDIGTRLLFLALELKHVSVVRFLVNNTLRHNDYTCIIHIPFKKFFEAVQRVWQSPHNWNEENLQMVEILAERLFKEGNSLSLYLLIKEGVRGGDVAGVEVIIRVLHDRSTYWLWDFVALAINQGCSVAVLECILSFPSTVPIWNSPYYDGEKGLAHSIFQTIQHGVRQYSLSFSSGPGLKLI
jgi:hypothetical protein